MPDDSKTKTCLIDFANGIGDSPQNINGTKKKYIQRLSGNHLFVIYLNLLTILIVL